MTKPATPKPLADAGYRIHFGAVDLWRPHLFSYWWTLSRPGWSGVETSEGDWATAGEAIEDAYRDVIDSKNFDDREVAAVLAGLRLLQREMKRLPPAIADIYTNCGELNPLSPAEIDGLCERINFGDV